MRKRNESFMFVSGIYIAGVNFMKRCKIFVIIQKEHVNVCIGKFGHFQIKIILTVAVIYCQFRVRHLLNIVFLLVDTPVQRCKYSNLMPHFFKHLRQTPHNIGKPPDFRKRSNFGRYKHYFHDKPSIKLK